MSPEHRTVEGRSSRIGTVERVYVGTRWVGTVHRAVGGSGWVADVRGDHPAADRDAALAIVLAHAQEHPDFTLG
jgi:hypothetical protein